MPAKEKGGGKTAAFAVWFVCKRKHFATDKWVPEVLLYYLHRITRDYWYRGHGNKITPITIPGWGWKKYSFVWFKIPVYRTTLLHSKCFQHKTSLSALRINQNYHGKQEIICSRGDNDVMIGALPTKAGTYAELTVSCFHRNQPENLRSSTIKGLK